MVGTGLLFMLIFHIGLKEPPRSCTYLFASKGSKRSAGNWIHWFKEVQFYQVCVKQKLNFVPKNSENCKTMISSYGFHIFCFKDY